ncbi:hypothetical protein G7Y79_00002g007050 [Physcia stellaris]|nr:hypothetical protein G7Y79_00002g007050 [Physcia stellaris]
MPSSYHGFVPQPMPLTPPYTDGSYPPGGMPYSLANMGQGSMPRHREQYAPASDNFNKQYLSRYPMRTYNPSTYSEHGHPSDYVAPTGNAKLPMLPPIQTQNHSVTEYPQTSSQRTKPVVPPKEEKPMGGVAQHLDYEMEQMVDFVSDSAQGMYDLYQSRICLADIDIARSVNPNVSVPATFRKYVSQVLTSTRLPSSTIFYGLYYLAHRMTELSKAGNYARGAGQVYRMLTTALLLGSKFLDDNTFQNRSWSEVSNIPVAELNTLELEWLKSIEWDLHVDLDHPDGFRLWEARWRSYQAKKVELSMASLKLSPLNPNIQRQPSLNKRVSPTLPYPNAYYNPTYGGSTDRLPTQWQTSGYDNGYENWPSSAKAQYSPPSAPHTGPNTPEWYGRGWYGNDYRSYGSSEATTPASAQSFQSFAQQASYQKAYPAQYNQGNWSGHNPTCGCGYCVPTTHDPFYAGLQYRSQTVAG